MNRRVEIVGELTEIERTRLYQTRTNAMRAIMNGKTMELGSHGQFKGLLDGPLVDKVDLQLTDEIGRGIETSIALPRIQIIEPGRQEFRPLADRESWTQETGLVPQDTVFKYRLVGKTDIGNYVELDNRPLDIDVSGQFESSLVLTPGRNAFVLSARNEKGFVRYANIFVRVKTDDYGVPILAVEPIPKLVLQLPPKGVAMRSSKLVVPAFRVSLRSSQILLSYLPVTARSFLGPCRSLSRRTPYGLRLIARIILQTTIHAAMTCPRAALNPAAIAAVCPKFFRKRTTVIPEFCLCSSSSNAKV